MIVTRAVSGTCENRLAKGFEGKGLRNLIELSDCGRYATFCCNKVESKIKNKKMQHDLPEALHRVFIHAGRQRGGLRKAQGQRGKHEVSLA